MRLCVQTGFAGGLADFTAIRVARASRLLALWWPQGRDGKVSFSGYMLIAQRQPCRAECGYERIWNPGIVPGRGKGGGGSRFARGLHAADTEACRNQSAGRRQGPCGYQLTAEAASSSRDTKSIALSFFQRRIAPTFPGRPDAAAIRSTERRPLVAVVLTRRNPIDRAPAPSSRRIG
jgi:hypothetical protein